MSTGRTLTEFEALFRDRGQVKRMGWDGPEGDNFHIMSARGKHSPGCNIFWNTTQGMRLAGGVDIELSGLDYRGSSLIDYRRG